MQPHRANAILDRDHRLQSLSALCHRVHRHAAPSGASLVHADAVHHLPSQGGLGVARGALWQEEAQAQVEAPVGALLRSAHRCKGARVCARRHHVARISGADRASPRVSGPIVRVVHVAVLDVRLALAAAAVAGSTVT